MHTKIQNLLVKRAMAQKKIRVEQSKMEETIKVLFDYVRLFNSLDEYTSLVFDKPISEILIIKEISHFIIPASVRIDSADKGWNDLLIRDTKPNGKSELSLQGFYDAQMAFRGYFKRTMFEDNVPLSDLKKHLNLTDILSTASINGKVWYRGNPFIPTTLTANLSFIDRDLHYVVDETVVIEDFIATLSLT